MFYEKVKKPIFWQEVRRNPAYRFIIDELLERYEVWARSDIKEIPYEVFMLYYKTGDRSELQEKYYFARRKRMAVCALLSLIYPEKEEYFTNLLNTIWAICNEYCWALPCHYLDGEYVYNDRYIDLMAAETGFALSEIRYLLGDRMGSLVNDRIHREIEKRIIHSFLDNKYPWEEWENNWAAVCSGSIAITFLYEFPEKFDIVKPRIEYAMERFWKGFKADGVCREGLTCWMYGFGFFTAYAQRLLEITQGQENLFENPYVKTVAQFPQKVLLEPKVAVNFSDCPDKVELIRGTMNVLRFHYGDLIQNFPKECLANTCSVGRWCFHLDSIVWFNPEDPLGYLAEEMQYYLPESAWFIKKNKLYSFAAKAGDNGEPHNHNDVGNFMLFFEKKPVLVDLGSGIFNRDNFGKNRYGVLCNRGLGHNIPILDGYEQPAGKEYAGKMEFDGENRVYIEMTDAYPKNRVSGAFRVFTLNADGVSLTDTFVYKQPCPVIERFVTYIAPKIVGGVVYLNDVKMMFDESVWDVKVSKEYHVSHFEETYEVYLIDFMSQEGTEKFVLDIEKGEKSGL